MYINVYMHVCMYRIYIYIYCIYMYIYISIYICVYIHIDIEIEYYRCIYTASTVATFDRLPFLSHASSMC